MSKRIMSVVNSQFEAEVLPHMDTLHKAAYRLKGNKMDAEDLAQETLLRALRFWDRYTPGTNCRAWLLRILNNQHINEWRVASRRAYNVDIDRLPEADLVRYAQTPVQTPSPEQKMISRSMDDRLYAALYRLKDDSRRLVVMYFLGDMPYRQIARLTNLSLGTVKSRMHRGKQQLRRSLNEYASHS